MTPWIRPLLVLLLPVWLLAARAGPPDAPLPDGAVARLGSVDWRLLTEPSRLVLSPDGHTLAVTGNDGTVILLDAQTGKCLRVLGSAAHAGMSAVGALAAYSPDGTRVAVCIAADAKSDRPISIRDGTGRREEQRIEFRMKDRPEPKLPTEAGDLTNKGRDAVEYVTALAFSPDGKELAAAVRFHWKCYSLLPADHGKVFLETEENVVRRWDLTSGKPLAELTGHKKEINSILFWADGRTLTTTGADGTLCCWDAATGREKGPRRQADRPLFCAAPSPDGKLLAAGSRESVLLWETAGRDLRARLAFPAPEVRALAWARDGTRLAGAGSRAIRLWNADSGAAVRDAPASAHPVTALAFSADGTRLFSGHQGEQVVRSWDAATLEPYADLGGPVTSVGALGFTPDSRQLLAATPEGEWHYWDARSGRPARPATEPPDLLKTSALAAVARSRLLTCAEAPGIGAASPGILNYSTDGRRLLALKKGNDHRPALVVSDALDNRVLREVAWEAGTEVRAALSPDGQTAALVVNGKFGFFDVASGEQRRYDLATREGGEPSRTVDVKFSPEGTRIVLVGEDGLLRVVSVKDGRLLAEIRNWSWDLVDGPPTTGVAFSPDGKTLAVGGSFASLSVWEVSTGALIRFHRGDRFVFSPDNRRVAILKGETLRLHDLYSGVLVHAYNAPGGFVGNFTFSPDGRLLAAACRDTTVLVWDTASAEPPTKPGSVEAGNREQLWSDLQGETADLHVEDWQEKPGSVWKDLEEGKSARAYRAMGTLIAGPDRSVPFLSKRLQTVPLPDAERLRRLLADLDSEDFARREAASRELQNLGPAAAPALRGALAGKPSAEVRKRLENLLRESELTREKLALARGRAIQVLERIGTKEARQLLKSLAERTETDSGSHDAREALHRTETGDTRKNPEKK